MAEFEKMGLESADLVAERIEQIKQLLPEVATEGGIDFDKLRLVLGDEIDEGTERYAFTWPGKTDAIRQSQTPSTATLRPCPEESVNWDETENLYIEGDNLEVLKLLQHSYHGRVKLIYIDPPYNTGKDFVYHDSFGDTIENYRQQAGLVGQSNSETNGRYHSAWCSMMYPRLKLARELLMDGGVIFISIDDHEARNLEAICNEIFGENSFITRFEIVNNLKGRNDKATYATCHEHLLAYAKGGFISRGLPLGDNKIAEYDQVDENGEHWQPRDLRKRGNGDRREDRPNMYFPIYYSETSGNCSLERVGDAIEILPKRGDGSDGRWRWGRDTVAANINLLIPVKKRNGEWGMNYRVYLNPKLNPTSAEDTEERREKPKSIWTGPEYSTDISQRELKALFGNNVPFDFPKPTALVKQIIEMACDNDDLVLDFFAGSSTTAEAIIALNNETGANRRFIMVQLPEDLDASLEQASRESSETIKNAINICRQLNREHVLTVPGEERIRRAGAKIAAEIEETNKQLRLGEEPKPVPDIGFRVLKLDESGIERPKPGELLLDVVKPDRSDEDIIFEMMLKWGLELTLPIEKVEAAGYPCYSVAYGELVCCLADGLNMQVLDAIARMEPRRVLMLDRILDDTTKLNAVQAFKRVEEKTGREVELRTV